MSFCGPTSWHALHHLTVGSGRIHQDLSVSITLTSGRMLPLPTVGWCTLMIQTIAQRGRSYSEWGNYAHLSPFVSIGEQFLGRVARYADECEG